MATAAQDTKLFQRIWRRSNDQDCLLIDVIGRQTELAAYVNACMIPNATTADQAVAGAHKDAKLLETQAAETAEHNAEQDIPDAVMAAQAVDQAEQPANLPDAAEHNAAQDLPVAATADQAAAEA